VLLCSHTAILLLGDGVDRVDDPRKVAEEGEQEAEPELDLAAELEEDAERGKDDGDEDVDAVRRALLHLAPASGEVPLQLAVAAAGDRRVVGIYTCADNNWRLCGSDIRDE